MVSESGQRGEVERQPSALPVAPPARDEPPEVEMLPGPQAEPQIIEPTDPEPSEDEPEEKGKPQTDAGNVVAFPTPARSNKGRPKRSGLDTLRVDYTKASTHTWVFRIRWREEDGREPSVVVSRVNDRLFKSVTKSKGRYAAFKKQLLSAYRARAVRRSDRTVSSAGRNV